MNANLLKKYKLIGDNNEIHYLYPDEITSIVPYIDKSGNPIMVVNYYDNEFLIISSIICNKIEVEDYIEYNSFN
jgi:hypothetical protein